MYEIAELEEQRDNHHDARRLYERIIAIDPNGYFAAKARERLDELHQKESDAP